MEVQLRKRKNSALYYDQEEAWVDAIHKYNAFPKRQMLLDQADAIAAQRAVLPEGGVAGLLVTGLLVTYMQPICVDLCTYVHHTRVGLCSVTGEPGARLGHGAEMG